MEQVPPGIDPDVPSAARIYDFFLGGKENFAVDRAVAQKLLELSPNIKESARANRRFLVRAVEYLADQGIRQFLDIGAGLPTQEKSTRSHSERPPIPGSSTSTTTRSCSCTPGPCSAATRR